MQLMSIYTVYFLCDENDEPFYIGKTVELHARTRQHLADFQQPRGTCTVGAFLKHKRMVEIRERGGSITVRPIFTTPDKNLASIIEKSFLLRWRGSLTNWIGRPRHLRLPRPHTAKRGTPSGGDFWRAVK